ncbi:hypothetical protein PsW64_03391 [Pseudovibrio sp. W64]|nr:hypothetical protein PsW64_03391 [Pseudovibrio sp. W64]
MFRKSETDLRQLFFMQYFLPFSMDEVSKIGSFVSKKFDTKDSEC